jgi:predicted phosphodiesterase
MNIADIYQYKIVQRGERTYKELAAEYGITGEQLRSMVRTYAKKVANIPEALPRQFEAPLRIPLRDTLILADIHAPYQNAPYIKQACTLAQEMGVQQAIIAGDLCNFEGLSSHAKLEHTTDPMVDIEHARGILYYMRGLIPHIYITPGNHDAYWIKKRGGSFKELIHDHILLGRYDNQFTTSEIDYLYLGNDFVVGHLDSYSDIPGKNAAIIAERERRHVIVGHDHIRGYMSSRSGYVGFSLGCALLEDRFYYKVRRLDIYPEWNLGFMIIKNGVIHHFDDKGALDGTKFRTFDEWSKKYAEP